MATTVEQLVRLNKIGQPIFEQFFALNDAQLKSKLASVLYYCDKNIKGLIESGDVERIIRNERPEKIKLYYYDTLSIDWMGIHYKPEHRSSEIIVRFDEHFKF